MHINECEIELCIFFHADVTKKNIYIIHGNISKIFIHLRSRIGWYDAIFYCCIASHTLRENKNSCFIHIWSMRHLFDSLQVWFQIWDWVTWSPLCNQQMDGYMTSKAFTYSLHGVSWLPLEIEALLEMGYKKEKAVPFSKFDLEWTKHVWLDLRPPHRKEYMPSTINLSKVYCWEVLGPMIEFTTDILLNGHVAKMTSKYLCL